VRGAEGDDPTIIRHLHDLAALESRAAAAPAFASLVAAAAQADRGRGGGQAPAEAPARFAAMLGRLTDDPLWSREYDEFVHGVSFAPTDEFITFTSAMESVRRLVEAAGG